MPTILNGRSFLGYYSEKESKVMLHSVGKGALTDRLVMSAMSTGVGRVVLLLRFSHCFGLTDRHRTDCEGTFFPCYEVLTLSGR